MRYLELGASLEFLPLLESNVIDENIETDLKEFPKYLIAKNVVLYYLNSSTKSLLFLAIFLFLGFWL